VPTPSENQQEGKDYLKEGFHAKSQADEVPAVDLELNVLMHIDDVTKEVQRAVTPTWRAAKRSRRGGPKSLRSEAANQKRPACRSNIITLFKGGQYHHLYSFKRYTDVPPRFRPGTARSPFTAATG